MTARDETRDLDNAKALSAAALTVLGHFERGQASERSLRRCVDADVAAAIRPPAGPRDPGSAAPVQVAVPSARVTIDGLRAHAVGIARRPDGSIGAYVIELGRVSILRDWMVSELTSVEDRRLLGERPREFDQDLPADLPGLIEAATQHRDQTAMELRAAHQRWRQARGEVRRRHKPEVERCQEDLERAEAELVAYVETQHFRRVRDRLLGPASQEAEQDTGWDTGR